MIITNRTRKNPLFNAVYARWYNMNRRCYNEKDARYKSYGAKGITVCDRWRNLNNFIEDVDKIEGFDIELLLSKKIHLDKDSIDPTNTVYCLEKCRFLPVEESNKYKPHQMKHFIATAPDGKEFVAHNQSEFAREHGLAQSTIADCLSGRVKVHRGWRFRYKEITSASTIESTV